MLSEKPGYLFTCENCTDYLLVFTPITRAKAKEMAREDGWIEAGRAEDWICPDCAKAEVTRQVSVSFTDA